MASRIAPRPIQAVTKHAPVKSPSYLAFIRQLPCVVTGRRPAQAAHVSYQAEHYGARGRGKSQKVSDRFALPLCEEEHRIQHTMNERAYWEKRGIDPHIVCLVLWGLYHERGSDGLDLAEKAIRLIRAAALPRTGGLARQIVER